MKYVAIELFRPLLVISTIIMSAYIVFQIWKIKKEQPQNSYEIRFLFIELWLLIISMLVLIQKDVTLFFSLYFD